MAPYSAISPATRAASTTITTTLMQSEATTAAPWKGMDVRTSGDKLKRHRAARALLLVLKLVRQELVILAIAGWVALSAEPVSGCLSAVKAFWPLALALGNLAVGLWFAWREARRRMDLGEDI